MLVLRMLVLLLLMLLLMPVRFRSCKLVLPVRVFNPLGFPSRCHRKEAGTRDRGVSRPHRAIPTLATARERPDGLLA